MQHFLFQLIGVSIAVTAVMPVPVGRMIHRPASNNTLTRRQSESDEKAAWQTLLSFEDQPLAKLVKAQAEKIWESIDLLVKPETQSVINIAGGFMVLSLAPRLITRLSDSTGQIRYILVEESPLTVIPGNSALRVSIFAPDGSLLRSTVFLSGWRIQLTGIRVLDVEQIGRRALEVRSRPAINGRDVFIQFYALVDDHLVLIRLEDQAGNLTRNHYEAPNWTIGPVPAGRSVKEWESALASTDAAEVLATLTWLGGKHRGLEELGPDYAYEDASEARLADHVRHLRRVKRALNAFVHSNNLWVLQAARLVVKNEN